MIQTHQLHFQMLDSSIALEAAAKKKSKANTRRVDVHAFRRSSLKRTPRQTLGAR
jgi:hypothetical protein